MDTGSVIVPRVELARIEQARKDLFAMFPNADTGFIVRLSKIADPMWEVANRKWPAAPAIRSSDIREAEAIADHYIVKGHK